MQINKTRKIEIILAGITAMQLLIFSWEVFKPLDRAEIIPGVANELIISHWWGNLSVNQYMEFKNIGNKQGSVNKIRGIIVSKDRDNFVLKISAQSKVITTPVYSENPFISITLNGSEFISGTYSLFRRSSKAHRDSVAKFVNRRYDEITNMENNDPYSIKPKWATDSTRKEIKNFILRNLGSFKEGEYYYYLVIQDDKDAILFQQCFSFVIYQSDINTFNHSIEGYSQESTFGINRPINNFVYMPLTIVTDQNIIASLKKKISD